MGKSKKHAIENLIPSNTVTATHKNKGKRDLEEDDVVKPSKKQKTFDKIIAPQKKKQPLPEETSESEDEEPSKPVISKQQSGFKKPSTKERSKYSSSEEDDSSDEDQPTKKPGLVKVKAPKQTDSSEESDSEEEMMKQQPSKSVPVKVRYATVKKEETSSDDSSDSDDEEPVKPPPKTGAKAGTVVAASKANFQPGKVSAVMKGPVQEESSSEDDFSNSDEEPAKGATALIGKGAAKQESSSEDDSSDDEEEPIQLAAKKNTEAGAVLATSKAKLQPAKGAAVKDGKGIAKQESSSEDDSSDSDEEPLKTSSMARTKDGAFVSAPKAMLQPAKGATVKNGKGAAKPESSSEEDSSDSDDSSDNDEDNAKTLIKPRTQVGAAVAASKPQLQPAKGVAVKSNKGTPMQESSSEDDTSDSAEPVKPASLTSKAKLQPVKGAAVKHGKGAAKQESSSEEDSSDSDVEIKTKEVKNGGKPLVKPSAKKMANSDESSSEESSDESDEEHEVQKQKVEKAKDVKTIVKPVVKPSTKKMESSEESSSEESSDESDEEPQVKKQKLEVMKGSLQNSKAPAFKPSAMEEDSSDTSDESDSEEEHIQNKKQVTGKDTANGTTFDSEDEDEDQPKKVKEKEDGKQKQIKTVVTPAKGSTEGGSKTVFVKNLAWRVDEDTVREFFQDAGEIHEVRLAMNPDGQFRGFGHIEFTSAEAAKKACGKTGELLAGRDVFVDLAQERVFSPSSGGKQDWKSPRPGGFSGSGNQRSSSDATAFVRGFDRYQDEDSIRSSLTEFFNECGTVQSIRIPTDRETGNIKGFAYVDFGDKEILSKAIEYNGSDLNGRYLMIEEASGSSGGRGQGGDFGGRGGRGGRGRGDFGGRGRGGRGGRGFGTPKQNVNIGATGKKTTFGEEE